MRAPGYPLAGVRVLDLTQYVAGPYCTQVLADLGATVLKVERPGGDVYRRQGPVFREGESASFLALNRGKRSIVLDLGDEEDRAQLERLLGEADVLVENLRPGTLERVGLGYADVERRHPRLIYCSISGFGQEGPLAREGGYDLTIQALSGLMAMTGHPGGPPAKIPIAALDFGSALYAVTGILAALWQRQATGRGQWVTTSILETGLAWLSMHITTVLLGGEEPRPLGTRSPFFAPYEAYRTADGHLVVVGTGGRAAWERLCGALGLEELVDDPRFAENSDRVAHAEELREALEGVLATRPTRHWQERLAAAGIVHAPVQHLRDVLRSEQVAALGAIGSLEHPRAGEVPIVRLPLTFSRARATATAPPPELGQGGELGLDGDAAAPGRDGDGRLATGQRGKEQLR
jgi:crotonobetainyl-CoA:carnitine CoA-transferase CaiB-like acyl-CoA transferase